MTFRFHNWAPRAIPQSKQSAVALVMTLIMLSVITVVAVAFLALSQRERAAVTQSTQQNDAEIVNDIGVERAKGEIVARLIAGNTNLNAVDLLVSLNYIRTNGFVTGQTAPVDPLNVNYEYRVGGAAGLNAQEFEQNIANLYYDPRVPVFINTNVPNGPQGPLEFRFYLDLNRNGRFETNGAYPSIDAAGRVIPRTTNHFVGDPEFVGVLENPLAPHSRTNRFIGRYAFIVLPIGKSLDANFIHNHAKSTAAPNEDGFLRNQGVGPWELNLAAFLADLNTNVWNPTADNYIYRTNVVGLVRNDGVAFRDALEIFTTRFGSFQNLAPAQQLFGVAGANLLNDGFVDHFSDGPLYITAFPPTVDDDLAKLQIRAPWPGSFANAGNIPRKNFFTPHDFFQMVQGRNPGLPADSFTNRLHRAGFSDDSYDRYTFYRMQGEISTDSASELPFANIPQLQSKISASNKVDFIAEPAGKINLHYNNLDFPITDMVPWNVPVPAGAVTVPGEDRFFNAVANVLLRSQFRFGVSNIYVTNYNVTIHRLLQVAANIHESLHNSTNPFPAIFRPNIITDSQGGQLISGYTKNNEYASALAWLPTSAGMPMVVGAKKGLPNFNEYVAETIISAARKLEMRRTATNSPPYETNEMFILAIDNRYGLEAWNSYTNRYSNTLDVIVRNNLNLSITNTDGYVLLTNRFIVTNSQYSQWPGMVSPDSINQSNSVSFKVPLYEDIITLSNGIYRGGTPGYIDPIGDTNYFVSNSGFYTPEWNLTVSNDLVFFLTSGSTVLDFVHLHLTNTLGLTTNFFNPAATAALLNPGEGPVGLCWSTNRRNPSISTPTDGVLQQIDISLGQVGLAANQWSAFGGTGDKELSVTNFRYFVFPSLYPGNNNTNLIQQLPFTPARKMVLAAKWEVNDPLVHHMEEHLKAGTNNLNRYFVRPFTSPPKTNATLGQLNNLYRPWGGRTGKTPIGDDVDMRIKDPGVRKSDDWNFPTNEVPGVGWLGRIHRGTPWQTLYMKADMAPANIWSRFSLDPFSHPTNDWRLVDVFTTAIHPNASFGQLSINQTNFAAWSALFSGVLTLSNISTLDELFVGTQKYAPWPIEPGSSPLITLYEGIQRRREQMPDKTFRRLGELLSVPELSIGYTNNVLAHSPFILPTGVGDEWYTDEIWERIPQQVLSLLKVGDPRYVIYAWGQSLRPAENSILSSGPYMGMCTNYQVTGEFVTRTVFQIEGTAGQPRPTIKGFNILSSD